MMTEARVVELERKLDTVMRGLNLLLFEEGEVFPEEEVKELKTRLDDYLKGRRAEFVTLDET
jgi:5-carboxymethyl-2-hydroxymuconate isomerase